MLLPKHRVFLAGEVPPGAQQPLKKTAKAKWDFARGVAAPRPAFVTEQSYKLQHTRKACFAHTLAKFGHSPYPYPASHKLAKPCSLRPDQVYCHWHYRLGVQNEICICQGNLGYSCDL